MTFFKGGLFILPERITERQKERQKEREKESFLCCFTAHTATTAKVDSKLGAGNFFQTFQAIAVAQGRRPSLLLPQDVSRELDVKWSSWDTNQ